MEEQPLKWKFLESGRQYPQHNMDEDNFALQLVDSNCQPTLRFYDWIQPSATYGYFINPNDYFKLEALKRSDFKLGKRPTGGGVLFHTTDLAFSILIPNHHAFYSTNGLNSYKKINSIIGKSISRFTTTLPSVLSEETSDASYSKGGFCMTKPTVYDVMIGDFKVGGAAQRRTKSGLLHQGTIFLDFPNEELIKQVLIDGEGFLDAMRKASYPLFQKSKHISQLRSDLKNAIVHEFSTF